MEFFPVCPFGQSLLLTETESERQLLHRGSEKIAASPSSISLNTETSAGVAYTDIQGVQNY